MKRGNLDNSRKGRVLHDDGGPVATRRGMPRIDDHQRGKEVFSPSSFRASMGLTTSWCQTSSLQNCGMIYFCCLWDLVCGSF